MCEEISFILSQEFVYHQLPHGIYLCIFFIHPIFFFLWPLKHLCKNQSGCSNCIRLLLICGGVVWRGDGLSAVRPVFIPPLHAQLADGCVYFS